MRVGMKEVTRLMTAMMAAVAAAACSGDDGGTEPTKTISIALSAPTLSVTQGTTGTVSVNLTRGGGFTGDVAVAVDGLPNTVTVAASPATLGSAVTTTTLTFTAAATATPGPISATVRATGTGVTAATAPLTITVVAAPTPSFTMALAPTTLSIAQGASGTSTVTLTRAGGFTGAVTLTAENLPTGVSAAFNPPSPTANTSTLTLTAAANATTGGPTNITLRGTGTGVTAQTATLALTVTAASAGGYTLSMNPATLTVVQGANGTSTVNITRTGGFAGSVNLTASGLPNGVTAAFNPADATGNTSTLTLTASATAATGPATVTIKGTSAGQTDQTTTLALTVNAAAGYTLAVNEATVTAAAGATGTANITLTRTGGFASAVALTAENLPAGVTAAFNPASVTANTSVLTLTIPANATPATSTVTVRGTATGQPDKTATFQLTITAAAGGYTLSMTPATLTVQQGTNGTATVNITRTGNFAGAVTLAATGLPNGVTPAFNPAAPTGNTSTLTLTASPTATTGTATVTITGTATGLANQTTTLALTVSQATGGTGNTTWEFCTVDQTPIWVAIQDGVNGTWTRVTPSGPNNTRFQFNITQAKAAIAYVTTPAAGGTGTARTFAARMSAEMQRMLLLRNRPTRVNAYAASSLADNYTLTIIYGTQTELNAQGTSRCLSGTGKTVNGSVAGLSSSATSQQSASISLGSASASASPQQLSFSLKDVPDGALDLIASRSTTTIDPATFSVSFALDKLIIRRGVNAPANSTMPVLDFGSSEAFDPVQANITIGNIGTDLGMVITSYFTSAGSSSTGAALAGFNLPSAGPWKYYGVPSNKQAPGDLHVAIAFGLPNSQSTDQSRFAALYFKDPTDRTVTLGAAFPAPTITTAATTPYVRFRAQGALPTEYNQLFALSYTQATAARSVSITATQNWLAGVNSYDFSIPDFSGVAGWDNNWGLKAGQATNWSVTGYGISGIGFGSGTPVEGSSFKGATRNGTITP